MQKIIKIYSLSVNNVVRYIGKTEKELNVRLKQHLYEKTKCHRYYWIQNLKKENIIPCIELVDIIPEQEWKFWEMYYISLFRSWGFKLVNSTNGGDGLDGFSHSEKTKTKLRFINLGKTHSEFSKQKMREKVVSQITKDAISKKLSLPIIQLNLNGKFIKEWKSSREVSRQLKIHVGAISDCLNKKTKSCNDFLWIFKYEYDKNKTYFILKEKRYKKKVAQLDMTGKIIKIWESIRKASIELKIKDSNISLCCKGTRKLAGGFNWKYF